MIACSSTIGATMMISERPNNPRGRKRFRESASGTIWDQHIANSANRLQVQRQLGVFLDLAAQARHLNIDRAFQRNIQPLAQFRAAEGAPRMGGEKLQ